MRARHMTIWFNLFLKGFTVLTIFSVFRFHECERAGRWAGARGGVGWVEGEGWGGGSGPFTYVYKQAKKTQTS